ncbi:hypothetical protein KKP04_07085 [Rhodomicrobium sp. Az07]|uniref:hypothetical protein n=1 Tax=Rhodomicrobium sp. Az07 TaxID=2839034 RepID=UPI001BEBAA0E|nr:hypothetical protein [Rhodomicrobium sp. Az07]MBT3070627.1 hypothetical protein [Rhodomicrobium sp. Az07]
MSKPFQRLTLSWPRWSSCARNFTLALGLLLPFAAATHAQTPLQEAIARLSPQQQAILRAYESARVAHAKSVNTYWKRVELKRKRRKTKIARSLPLTLDDYVAEHPPVYKGPKRPADIMAMLPKPPKPPVTKASPPIPVVSDFLREAEATYGFRPDRVPEDDFMIAYALEAVKLGLGRDQVVRVYALETGGMGTHDLQSGYNPRTGRAASTAIGYAQLLAANSIEQVRKEGKEFASRLERLAQDPGMPRDRAQALLRKAALVRRMTADARRVRDGWSAHVKYAMTPKGLAMHALNLDGHIGPWLQVIKLRSVVEFARKRGFVRLTGGQLELMNLAGPGSGFEMLVPPGRDMPTANFFERGGYERNPVVHERTGAELLAKLDEIMDRNVQKPGARRFAAIFDRIQRRLAAGGRSQGEHSRH